MKRSTKVLAITSGKGGVGKTTSTINLGIALTQAGHKILLLDADLGLANINIMLGFKPQKTIDDLISGRATIDEIIVHHHTGLDIIPATSGVYEVTNLTDDAKRMLLESFSHLDGLYDYMLIDTSAGIGNNVLYFNVASERVLVIVDPEPTSITDAYALIKVLSSNEGVKSFDIIVNRAPKGDDGRSIFKKLATATDRFLDVKMNLLGCIQDDDAASEAIMKQSPLLSLYPSTRASRDYIRVARNIEQLPRAASPRGGLQFFFESLLSQNTHP
ncbi:MAG TPA: MinD/ParA family protein [Oligoflexia bacterium]|nr:MinD/ParA family protein [Oligoflexia bacterium]HMP48783.1 MinD/ParA family protein [Oligoflexia bacterium]